MGDPCGKNIPCAQGAQIVAQAFLLRFPSGKPCYRFTFYTGKADHVDADRLSHPRDDGDVLQLLARAAVNSLLALDDSAHTPKIHVQTQIAVAQKNGPL